MGATDRTIQYLHLRALSVQSAMHAVHRLEDALRCASLPDDERLDVEAIVNALVAADPVPTFKPPGGLMPAIDTAALAALFR